jgi:hypothetical protein
MESTLGTEEPTSLAVEIVEKVARLEGRDAIDLPPVGEAIDIDALEQVAQAEDARVAFRYLAYEVVVEAGTVTVNER